jgi:transcription initiation factor TFIIIB Brf1 subunit/transcription initiation factor TFIIB
MSRQRHNFLHVSKMEIDCLSCYAGKIILDIDGNAACENCGVEVPPLEYQEMLAVSANNPENNKGLSYTSYRKKHLAKVGLLVDTIKNDLQFSDGICQDVKYLYKKAYSQGYPCRTGNGKRDGRHFYLTECVGACIYLASLSRGKRYVEVYDRKRKNITPKQVQNELNRVKQIVLPRYKRHVEASRIERCARLMVKELGLQIRIPDSPPTIDHTAQRILNQQCSAIESAIVDIADNLGVTKSVSKALSMFESKVRRNKEIIFVNGHKRKPDVVAGAFIYLAAKKTNEKVTLKSIKKIGCINHESLQKILANLS